MLQYLMYLGDSTPRDDHIRKQMVKRLAVPIHRPERDLVPLDERVSALEELLSFQPESRFVLIGRSSGARVVTQAAANPAVSQQVAAVVVLGYPFRNPRRGYELDRILHLYRLGRPCLIVQGTDDEYGGPRSVAAYHLPASIDVRFFPTDHRLEPPDEVWVDIAACIRGFLADKLGAASVKSAA